MRALMILAAAMPLLAACASDPSACRTPTEREMRQGEVHGIQAGCKPAQGRAAPSQGTNP